MDVEKLIQAWNTSYVWWWTIGLFLSFAIVETVRPSRASSSSLLRRWGENFAFYAAGIALLYLVKPDDFTTWLMGGIGEGPLFALLRRIGGSGLVLAVGILLADLVVFLLHVAEHRFFVLWRIHVVHHTDQRVDLTTGLRHHPSEVLLNAVIASFVLLALGQPLWVSGGYATLLTTFTLFSHSNSAVPEPLDRVMRLVLVTPSLHRVHHSVNPAQYNTNFGGIFSIWDRLCGTYAWIPPEQPIEFGVSEARNAPGPGMLREWLLPFTLRRASTPLSPNDAGGEVG